MTIEQAKARLLSWCMSQVGTQEGPNNCNKYAESAGLKRMYGWDPQNQPWCDIFVDSGFIECFGLTAACAMTYQPMGAGSALCRQSAKYYADNGAFYKRPETGDQVFFFASGAINHTGVVVRVVGGSIITVEGNSNDQVSERCYSMGDSRIAGYGRPRWETVAEADVGEHGPDGEKETTIAPAESYVLRLPVLRIGARGAFVAAMQGALIDCCCSCGPDGADGVFGAETERAVIRFQRSNGLAPDGIIGKMTAAALLCGEAIENTGGKDNGRTDKGD